MINATAMARSVQKTRAISTKGSGNAARKMALGRKYHLLANTTAAGSAASVTDKASASTLTARYTKESSRTG